MAVVENGFEIAGAASPDRRTRQRVDGRAPARSDAPPVTAVFAVAATVGVLFCLLAALDIGAIANPLGFCLAVLAHGCLSILVVEGIYELRDRSKRGVRRALYVGVVIALFGALAFLLFKLDSFLLGSLMAPGLKTVYVLSIVAVSAVMAAGTFLVLSPTRFTGQRERIGWRVLAALTGCIGGAIVVALVIGVLAWHRQHDTAAAIPQPTAVRGIGGTYLALGDSYSAGEGLGPFQHGTDSVDDGGNGCHRSDGAYPMLIEFEPPKPAPEFRACSGAVTSDVRFGFYKDPTGNRVRVDAQVDGGEHPDVGLVTITIGGNDVVFSGVVQTCFLHENCLRAPFEPPDVDAERPAITYPSKAPLVTWAEEAARLLSDRVEGIYAELRRNYPAARIVVLGYPYLFPAGAAPWDHSDCASVLRRVDRHEREGLRALTDKFNNTLYAHAVDARIEFVSPAAVWDGHEPCGTDGQYTNAVKPVASLANFIDGGSFHPNERGQEQLAALVACYLGAHPTPPSAFADGQRRDLSLDGFVDLTELGLVPPPGSRDAPVPCPTAG